MSDIASFTVADDSGSTNNRTFGPISTTGGVSMWEVADSSTTAGRPTLSLTHDVRKPNRQTDRIRFAFAYPIEGDVADGYPVLHTARCTFEVVVPAGLTDDQREDFAYLATRLPSETQILEMIRVGEAVY